MLSTGLCMLVYDANCVYCMVLFVVYACRAQEVPDVDPNWNSRDGFIGFTRPMRSRSSSFYSDNDEIMDCINGEK